MAKMFIKCINEEDKAWFIEWCKRNNTTMSHEVRHFINRLRKEESRKKDA